MKYAKLFQNHSDYEEYITGDNVDLSNVSVCEDDSHRHYNRYIPFRMRPAEIAYYDFNEQTVKFTYRAKEAAWEGHIPIGITVIPEGHMPDGKRRIVSLTEINSQSRLEHGSFVGWGNNGIIPELPAYYEGGFITDVFNVTKKTPAIPCPFNEDGSKNPDYQNFNLNPGETPHAVTDFNGESNTDFLVSHITESKDYPAARIAKNYIAAGTNLGDWYLPACGEFGYIYANFYNINKALQELQDAGIYTTPFTNYAYWTSSQAIDENHITFVTLPLMGHEDDGGGVGYTGERWNPYFISMRAFCAI